MRAQVVAFALASAVAVGSTDAYAQPQRRSAFESHSPRRYLPRAQRLHPAGGASVPLRTNTLLDFDTTQRDGHLTPEERRLLRQHIEDAVRELYKR